MAEASVARRTFSNTAPPLHTSYVYAALRYTYTSRRPVANYFDRAREASPPQPHTHTRTARAPPHAIVRGVVEAIDAVKYARIRALAHTG